MAFYLSKTADALLSPLAWVIVLLSLGFLGERLRRRQPLFVLLGLALLYAASIQPVANALWRSLEQPPLESNRPYDAIVLLGGVIDHHATRTHGPVSYNDNVERLLTTFDLMRKHPGKPVIVSGGRASADDPVVEANVLGQQLVDWGIAKHRILLEPTAQNTRQNAVEVANLAREHGFDRLLLITSAFHMPRSLDCFREVGLDVAALPVDYRSSDPSLGMSWIPRAHHFAATEQAVRELSGRMIYRVLGYGRGA